MRKRRNGRGCIAASFGLGLFLAVCFPSEYLVVVLAILITVCGFCLCKR